MTQVGDEVRLTISPANSRMLLDCRMSSVVLRKVVHCLATHELRSRFRQRGLSTSGKGLKLTAPVPYSGRTTGPRWMVRLVKGPLLTQPPPVPRGITTVWPVGKVRGR